MIVNVNTMRWLRSSLNKWFDDSKGDYGLVPMGDTVSEAIKILPAYAELRMSGPEFMEQLASQGVGNLEIQALCSAQMTGDIYLIDRIVGVFHVAFANFIPVFKYGEGADDDQSQFGCLILRSDVPRPVDTLQWGQLDPTTKVTQTAVEGAYRLDI
jgi:hypothetical protein